MSALPPPAVLDPPAVTDTDSEFARIVDELTRRGFLSGGVAAAALLGLVACGSGEVDSTGTPEARTRVVDSVMGKVTVPADPKRVVSVHVSAQATLYDLAMTPLGVADPGANYISPRYRPKWTDATKVYSSGELHLEDVAVLQPDLILGVDWPFITKHHGELTKLAPTVIVPSTSWQATARGVAAAVGRMPALDRLQTKLRTRSAAISSDYDDVLSRYRWDILQGGFDPGKYWLYGAKAELGPILADAGVRYASGTRQTPATESRAISYEKIGLLADADVIGYYANFDGTPNNEGPKLFAQTLWKRLPAVRSGRLVPFPDFLPSGYGDALAVLDELEAGLKKIGAAG